MQILTAISCYPVKSLRGHALDRAVVEPCGLAGDRRWMVIDEAGRFVTRREVPAMALIDVAVEGDGLVLSHPDLGRCHVSRPDERSPVVAARVWRDAVPGDGDAAVWAAGGTGAGRRGVDGCAGFP